MQVSSVAEIDRLRIVFPTGSPVARHETDDSNLEARAQYDGDGMDSDTAAVENAVEIEGHHDDSATLNAQSALHSTDLVEDRELWAARLLGDQASKSDGPTRHTFPVLPHRANRRVAYGRVVGAAKELVSLINSSEVGLDVAGLVEALLISASKEIRQGKTTRDCTEPSQYAETVLKRASARALAQPQPLDSPLEVGTRSRAVVLT